MLKLKNRRRTTRTRAERRCTIDCSLVLRELGIWLTLFYGFVEATTGLLERDVLRELGIWLTLLFHVFVEATTGLLERDFYANAIIYDSKTKTYIYTIFLNAL